MKRIIVNITRLIRERPRRRIRKRLLLFSFCFACALLIWLLNSLSKTYRFTVTVPVIFENVPAGKAIVMKDRKEVKLMIEGTGWHFLRAKINMLDGPVYVDLRNLKEKNSVNLDKQLFRLNEQIPAKVRIMSIEPSRLNFEFETKEIKKVPVRLMSNISFDQSYHYSGKISIMPDSVLISGPSEMVGKIVEWKTDVMNFSNINYTVVHEVPLASADPLNLDLSVRKVLVTIPVEKYTEGEITVPIRLKSVIGPGVVKLLPSVCKVRYQVSLSKFDDVQAQDFNVVARIDSFHNDKLNLQIINYPDYIIHASLLPEQVDYIIRK